MIKNIIFDMGNVLLDYNPDVCLNYFLDNEDDKALIKKILFNGQEWIDADRGLLTDEDIYERVKDQIPERLHPALKNCATRWHMCMKPVNGAKEFCEYVKENGYHLYVLSNASTSFYDYFPEFAPLSYFDGIVVSCDIHIIKPERGIYEYLLNQYQLIAEECFFIDDRPENIEGARQIGMNGVVFYGDFQEIKELLLQITDERI